MRSGYIIVCWTCRDVWFVTSRNRAEENQALHAVTMHKAQTKEIGIFNLREMAKAQAVEDVR